MMIFDACVACDPRSNSIDFGIKGQGQTWKVWICCHRGYLTLLGQVSLCQKTPFVFTSSYLLVTITDILPLNVVIGGEGALRIYRLYWPRLALPSWVWHVHGPWLFLAAQGIHPLISAIHRDVGHGLCHLVFRTAISWVLCKGNSKLLNAGACDEKS